MRLEGQQKLTVVPLVLSEACDFVTRLHRHHQKPHKHRFSIGVVDEEGVLRGVAIADRPVSRMMDQKFTLEVTRLATDGCPNACSHLYAAVARAAKAMGFHRVITYILESEPGTSLRAVGWEPRAKTQGGSWSRSSRPREDKHPLEPKVRWEKDLV